MSKRMRFLGWSSLAVLAVASSAIMWMAPEAAISKPSLVALSHEDVDGPAPQRVEVAGASGTLVAANGTGASLPGGASALNETYEDWLVSCVKQGNVKRCTLSQIQSQQNGQRVLAIELTEPNNKSLSGMLLLPFGIALDSGITLQVDDKPAMRPYRFRTCLPDGCIVDVAFDAPTLDVLRAGTTLKVQAVVDGGAAVPLSISLRGFTTALDRVVELAP